MSKSQDYAAFPAEMTSFRDNGNFGGEYINAAEIVHLSNANPPMQSMSYGYLPTADNKVAYIFYLSL